MLSFVVLLSGCVRTVKPAQRDAIRDVGAARDDSNGQQLTNVWSLKYDGEWLRQVEVSPFNGDVIAIGWFSNQLNVGGARRQSNGHSDIYVACFDSSGRFRWVYSGGGTDQDHAYGLAIDSQGNIYVSDWFRSPTIMFPGGGPQHTNQNAPNTDLFLLSLNKDGGFRWSRGYGGSDDDDGIDLAVDAADNLYVAGRVQTSGSFGGSMLTSAGFSDALIASYDSRGNHRWSKNFGGASTDKAEAIAVGNGRLAVAGFTNSPSFDLLGAKLDPFGNDDVLVLNLDPTNGSLSTASRFGSPRARPCTRTRLWRQSVRAGWRL
jgi:hypothetical protein